MRAAALVVAFAIVSVGSAWCGEEAETLLDRAFSLNEEAGHLLDRGEIGQGQTLARRSLEAFEKAQGPQAPELGNALCTLAEVDIVRGDFDGGERHLRRAARLAELGGAAPVLKAAIAGRLGALDLLRGRYPDAESHLERALELGEKAVGPAHPALYQVWQLLAETYRLRNRLEEARTAYERALQLVLSLGPGLHVDAVVSLSGLALVAELEGDPERARSYHVRAVGMAEEVFAPRDAALAIYLARYASFHAKQGDAPRADALFTRAVAIVDGCRGHCAGARGLVLEGLAAHLAAQGRSRDLARVRSILGALTSRHEGAQSALAWRGPSAASAWPGEMPGANGE